MAKSPEAHKCDKEHVNWRKEPDLGMSVGDGIQWYGECQVCGKVVFEIYNQEPELYDADKGEPIQ